MRGQAALAAPARFPVGLAASSLAHAGAVLWVALGGLFFADDEQPQIAGVEVSLISGAAFDALMARSDGDAAPPDPTPFADMQPVPSLMPEVQAATPPATPQAMPLAVTPPPPTLLTAPTAAPTAPDATRPLAVPAAPVTTTAPVELARAPMLAPVGATPSLPQANVVSALVPQSGALAPAQATPAAPPPPTVLQPLPDLPAAQEAGPDTPRPRPRPAPEDRRVAKAASPAPAQVVQKQVEPERPAARAAQKPAATTDGDQEVNNRRGAAEGAADGASVDGKAKAAGKVAGNARASNYGGQVLRQISRTKKPKAPARGTVVVGFTIADSGGLAGVQVLRSSGAPALDAVALDHIRRAAPFPAPPEGAKRSYSFEFVGRP
ncbi:TonB family protein [Fertoebacter nigrum]|uniref:TonB family protein n=1 Tax=Fertoeibacter niger TaxID=2656921 RepID=A0A8X8GXJ8_9RHOB|nr:TonB family protein [Fertoeibacter niger]NUB46179.1 TonB family protein [Fertoeibacter niger]